MVSIWTAMGMADLGWSTSKQCDFPTVKGNTIHIQTIQHMFHGPHGEKKGSPSPWFRGCGGDGGAGGGRSAGAGGRCRGSGQLRLAARIWTGQSIQQAQEG